MILPESNMCNNRQNFSTVLNIHFNNANVQEHCQVFLLWNGARITEPCKLLVVMSHVNLKTFIKDLFHRNDRINVVDFLWVLQVFQ